jgi:hypothetical protein
MKGPALTFTGSREAGLLRGTESACFATMIRVHQDVEIVMRAGGAMTLSLFRAIFSRPKHLR